MNPFAVSRMTIVELNIDVVSDVPGFVAYPYLDDPFDDNDNQDKYLLHNIFPALSYPFSAPFLSSGFNYCIRHLTLFQNEHHLYNEYKSHFISQLSAITDSSSIEKKRISGDEYGSMFYFTVLHKSSFVPGYKDKLICFLCRIIRILDHIYCLCGEASCCIRKYINLVNCILLETKKLECLVRSFGEQLGKLTKTINLLKQVFHSFSKLGFSVLGKISLGCLKSLGISIETCIETTVTLKYSMKHLGSVLFYQSKLCLIKSELGKQREQIQSFISKLRCVMRWLLCNKSPKDIVEELTSIIKSITETLESAKYLAREVRCIVESDCATLECIRSRLSKMCPSIQKIVLSLKFSVRIFLLSTKDMLCVLNSLNYSIKCDIPDFKPYLCVIERNLECVKSVSDKIKCKIVSHFKNFHKIVDCIESVISSIDYYWSEVDSFIDVRVFLKCSMKSIKANVSELQRRFIRENKNGSSVSRATNSNEHNDFTSNQVGYIYDFVWNIFSGMNIPDIMLGISILYEYAGVQPEIEKILENTNCYCIICVRLGYYDHKTHKPLSQIITKDLDEYLKAIKKEPTDNEENHLCICLVVGYKLYPILKKCMSYFEKMNVSLLYSYNRHFDNDKRTRYLDPRISSLMFLILRVIQKLFCFLEKHYLKLTYVFTHGAFKCFCNKNDSYYTYIMTTMLCLSSIMEDIYASKVDSLRIPIRHLSNLNQQLGSLIDKVQKEPKANECPAGQRTVTSQCPSTQALNNIMLVELYKNLASIFSQNLRLLKFSGVYFLLGLKLLVDQLSNVASILNPMISCNLNNSIVDYFVSVKETIMIHKKNSSGLKSFYQFFSMLSFSLINSKCLCEKDKQKVKEVTILISSVYISIVSKKQEQEKDECFFKEPADRILVASCIGLIYYLYNDLSLQLSNKVVLDFMVYSEDCKKKDEISYYLTRRKISYPENMCKYSRNNRIVDSTNVITNNKLEGGSNNNYTYNDAYRINTSRAHGSLKYIIIKIVLILIIVVMTIFHPRCVYISRHKKVN